MPPALLDPNEEQRSATHVRLVVSAWLALMAAQAYLCRFSLSVAATNIRTDLRLSEDEMGIIMGAFYWAYAVAQIPSSRLGERFGARHSLPWFVVTWSLMTALFGANSLFPLLLAVWVVAGLAQAGAFPVATRTIAIWYPQSERALASGFLVAMMSAGAATGAALTGLLIERIAWQYLLLLYALPGLLWSIGFYLWFRNRPEEHPNVNAEELSHIREGVADSNVAPSRREPTPWGTLLTSWAMWMICGQQFCRAAAVIFFGTWFPTFLKDSRHITVAKSGLLTILPHVAIAAAGLIGGAVADAVFRKTGRLDWSRKGLAVTSLILSTMLIFAAYFVNDPTLAVVVMSVGIFCAGLAGPAAYTVTMDMGGRHVGAVFATMNMAGNIGASLLPSLIPAFRRQIDSMPSVVTIFDGDSWNAVLVLVAFLHLAAAACWLMLPLKGEIIQEAEADIRA